MVKRATGTSGSSVRIVQIGRFLMKWVSRLFLIPAFIFIYIKTDWGRFSQILELVNVSLVLRAFLFLLLIDLLRAVKMVVITGRLQHPVLGVSLYYRYNMISSFYSLILPGDLAGGGVRWFYYRSSIGNYGAAHAVLVDSYLQFLSVVIFFIPSALILFPSPVPALLGAGVLVSLLVFPVLVNGCKLFRNMFRHISDHFGANVTSVIRKIPGSSRPYKRVALALAVSMVYQVFTVVFVWQLAAAASISISWSVLVYAITGLTVIQLLPGILGGIGVREASLAGLLIPMGFVREEAVVLGVLISLVFIFRGLLGGIAAFTVKTRI